MSDFEEALKRSVLGLGEAYVEARNDLHDETAAASESVKKITNGVAQLVLKKEEEEADGTFFELYLAAERSFFSVAVFLISPRGYPIKVASNSHSISIGVCEAVLRNRDDVRAYFNNMASSPDSRLVLRMAFLIRKIAENRKQPV